MKKNDILQILIPLFIFVLAWIVFSVHHNIVTSTISQTLNVQISPISPSFDTTTVAALRNRQNVTPIYEMNIPVENIVIPATSSAQVIPTPTPTVAIQPVSSGAHSKQHPEGVCRNEKEFLG